MSVVFLIGILLILGLNLCFVLRRRFDYLFFIFLSLLPIYITSLSIIYKHSSDRLLIQICQFSKEILLYVIPAFALLVGLIQDKAKIRMGKLDIWMLVYFCVVLLYLFLPIGGEIGVKIGAFRSLVALCFAFVCGRLTSFNPAQKKWIFYSLGIIAFLSGVIAIAEFLFQTSIHEYTGYSQLLGDFYNMPPSGHFGLTWTFETENGIRRFSSFFSDPLEFAASLLFLLPSIIIILWSRFSLGKMPLLWGALIIGVIGLFVSVSRASIVSFILQVVVIFYYFSYRKRDFFIFLSALIIVLVFMGVFASHNVMQMIDDTISFRNASSLGHLIEWLHALDSIINNPLGIGLGTSGNVAAQSEGDKVGGENQYLIIAVQIGLIGLLLYLIILSISISASLNAYKNDKNGLDGKLALLAAVTKIGLLLPLFTANVELYSFVSYLSWWLVGYVTKINISDANRN